MKIVLISELAGQALATIYSYTTKNNRNHTVLQIKKTTK
jgi:hypothetical protein